MCYLCNVRALHGTVSRAQRVTHTWEPDTSALDTPYGTHIGVPTSAEPKCHVSLPTRHPQPPATALKPAHVLVQETGRGGRDGAEACCLLYYNYSDAQKARHMLTSSAQENGTPPEVLRCNMDSLNAMVGIRGVGGRWDGVWAVLTMCTALVTVGDTAFHGRQVLSCRAWDSQNAMVGAVAWVCDTGVRGTVRGCGCHSACRVAACPFHLRYKQAQVQHGLGPRGRAGGGLRARRV